MNIINKIERNEFLKTIFPDGLNNNLLIGNLGLRVDGYLAIDLHTLQEPKKEISKWGVWGESYNVIVIKILCGQPHEINILNWEFNDFSNIHFDYIDDKFIISAKKDEYFAKITCGFITFQECTTYIL